MTKERERRLPQRFRSDGAVFAVLRPKKETLGQNIDILGRVLDINIEGLAISYIADHKEQPETESYYLDIVLAGRDLYLANLPFNTVWDGWIDRDRQHKAQGTRRRGLTFGDLTRKQREKLGSIIRDHTKADSKDKCRPLTMEETALLKGNTVREIASGLHPCPGNQPGAPLMEKEGNRVALARTQKDVTY